MQVVFDNETGSKLPREYLMGSTVCFWPSPWLQKRSDWKVCRFIIEMRISYFDIEKVCVDFSLCRQCFAWQQGEERRRVRKWGRQMERKNQFAAKLGNRKSWLRIEKGILGIDAWGKCINIKFTIWTNNIKPQSTSSENIVMEKNMWPCSINTPIA